ncbi:MAG: transposase [Blautia faecis]
MPEQSNEEAEYLVTNITDPSISPALLYNLYFERWNIETKYRELKEWWELEEFTGTSCNSIEQELYINLLFSNLAALVKTEADSIVKQKAFIKNKWAYQSKRTFIIGEVKALVPQLLFMSIEILPVITNLILKASKKRSQIHPGRCYERSKRIETENIFAQENRYSNSYTREDHF